MRRKKLFYFIKLFTLFFIIYFFESCEKDLFQPEKNFKVYTIKQGRHYSNSFFRAYGKRELSFVAVFDSSAIYETGDSINQADLNKLYGFSDCSLSHHENSARFAWRWYNKHLEIHAYAYKDSVRTYKYLCNVQLDKEYEYKIKVFGGQYHFSINGVLDSLGRGCNEDDSKKIIANYYLFPYFGGDEPAPHDIKIKIKDL